jgi:AGZA family xanthine/uracil permease-like MFS transporter
MFPNIAQLVQIILSQANGALLTAAIDPAGTMAAAKVSPDFVGVAGVFVMLAHGFILTGMLWGGILAFLADRKALEALILLGVCAVFTLFGVMHSVDPSGGVYLPWKVGSTLPIEWAVGYGIVGLTVAVLSRSREFRQPAPAE